MNPMAEVAYARGPPFLGAPRFWAPRALFPKKKGKRGARKCGAPENAERECGGSQKTWGSSKRAAGKRGAPENTGTPQSGFITKMELH